MLGSLLVLPAAALQPTSGSAEPLRAEDPGSAPLTSASLVRDLWPGPIVDEFNFALPASFPATDLVESGGLLYFSFLEPGHGRELWRTDGTPGGTLLVRDLTPGREGDVDLLTPLRTGVLLASGSELWWSDGSPDTTRILTRHVAPPRPTVSTTSFAFFRGCDDLRAGCALWLTDGTPEGTRAVTGRFGALDSAWEIAPTNDPDPRVYFRVSDPPHGTDRLYLYHRSDEAVTELLETPDSVGPLVPANADLYFVTDPRERLPATLWRSDGTAEGTVPVLTHDALRLLPASLGSTAFALELEPGPSCRLVAVTGTQPLDLAGIPACPRPAGTVSATGGLLRFVDADLRLWRSDGTPAGTFVEAEDLPSDHFVGTPRGLVFVHRAGLGPTWGDAVVLLTPTGPATHTRKVLVDDLLQVGAVASLGADILFTGGPAGAPQDLWRSDGTSAGTQVAVPFGIGSGGPIAPSDPRSLGRSADRVLLLADDDPIYHPDPWQTDGFANGTSRLAEDGRLLDTSGPGPELAAFTGGGLWKRAATPPSESNLWLLDPLVEAAERTELRGGEELFAFELGKRLHFTAQEVDAGGVVGGGLYSTDGTTDGTRRVATTGPSSDLLPGDAAWTTERLYFDQGYGGPVAFLDEALHRLDLESGESTRISGFPPTRLARDTIERIVATPERVFVLAAVSTAAGPPLDPDDPLPSGDSLLILTPGESDRLELALVPDALAARADSRSLDLRNPTAYRGRLALRQSTRREGEEGPSLDDRLLLTDGTSGRQLASLEPAPLEVDWNATAVGDLLYFTPLTEEAGQELWVSDGTADGTRQVADLAPGLESATPHALAAVDGRLLFAASTPEAGSELWATNGTEEGTVLVLDLAQGPESGDPAEPVALADRILFSGHRSDVGRELFSFERDALEPTCSTDVVRGSVCLGADRFRVSVDWLDRVSGDQGRAVGAALTRDTASFWFFEEENVELLVKVLDGRSFNDAFWLYTGAVTDVSYWITVFDTVTGESKTYENRQGSQCGVGDVGALPEDAEVAGLFDRLEPLPPADAPAAGPDNASATCEPSSTLLCLQKGRFAVEVSWETAGDGASAGSGLAVPATPDSGYFWFFSPENVELVVKVLDGRAVNGRYWVYFGALSDVAYDITVTDTASGKQRTYRNVAGSQCGGADVEAFSP